MVEGTRGGRARTLADVIATEAPVPTGRALALMVAVSRTVGALDPDRAPRRLGPDDVLLSEDGTVTLVATAAASPAAEPDSELGASIGRLLFALLVGRRPIDHDDAFQPTLRAALPPSTCALIARSASESPGQWPSPGEWTDELTQVAGALAPPLPAPERRRTRRRQVALGVALVVLVAASIIVLWLAPRWWDSANDDEGSPAPARSGDRTATQLDRAAGQLDRASS